MRTTPILRFRTIKRSELQYHYISFSLKEHAMSEIRKGAVKLKGNPVDLAGAALTVGAKAPEFSLQSNALAEVTLASSQGKTRIIATVPSLDTGVCHAETKKFNDQAASLPDVEILVVSMDLPFGQKRWCGAENVDKIKTLSAHRCTKFGEDFGVLIKGGGLDRCLCRAVFVIDGNGIVKYAEYCPEITEHPNYDAVIAAAK
jgi:thiol peroxidase